MGSKSRSQLLDVLLEHDPELHPTGQALPLVTCSAKCSQSALKLGYLIKELLQRFLTREGGRTNGRELNELMFRRSESLELDQSSVETLKLDQEKLILGSCLAILWEDMSQVLAWPKAIEMPLDMIDAC